MVCWAASFLTWEILSLISIGTSTSGSSVRACVTFSMILACSDAYSVDKPLTTEHCGMKKLLTWTEIFRVRVELSTLLDNFDAFLGIVVIWMECYKLVWRQITSGSLTVRICACIPKRSRSCGLNSPSYYWEAQVYPSHVEMRHLPLDFPIQSK